MTLKSAAVKAGIATVALTALGLVAAAPASAHTNNMYTYLNYDSQIQQAGFVTYSKTDGTTAYLPTTYLAEEITVRGIEVAAEKGTEVARFSGDFWVRTWDHTTGEAGDFVPLTLPGASELTQVIGLDTLNDGTTVTLIEFEVNFGDSPVPFWAIASVDAATGQLEALTDLTGVMADEPDIFYYFTSVATDPISGTTYVFLRQDDTSAVFFLPVTVSTDSVGTPTQFTGEGFEAGSVDGSDFDADGSLFFNYYDQTDEGFPFSLVKLGAPSTWPTAARADVSRAPAEESRDIAELALTIEHTALANTGAELPVVAWLLVGTVAVLAGGVTVTVARRRSGAVV